MRRRAIPVALLLALSWTPSAAQTTTARIEVLVRDPSAAPLPDALVSVIQRATGIRWVALARRWGVHVRTELPPSVFSIEIRRQGFQTTIVDGINSHRRQSWCAVIHVTDDLVSTASHTPV